MKTGESGRGVGRIPLCDEDDLPLGQHGPRLTRAVRLSAQAGGQPFTVLPAGTEYRVLQVRAADAQIVARWPGWALERYSLDVRGWLPSATLPEPPDARPRGRAVIGRVVLPPGADPARLRTLAVVTRDRLEDGPLFRAAVGADGHFSLPVEPLGPRAPDEDDDFNARLHRVEVISPSGELAGVDEEAPALPGGADEVVINVVPTVEIRGLLESPTGALVPDAPVSVAEMVANADTRTGPDGRFRFLVLPGQYTVAADEDSSARVEAGALGGEVTVRQKRRPSIFGSVPRRSDGKCVATDVKVKSPTRQARDERRSFPVDSHCRYTAAEPACFEGTCPPGVPDASVFVELADARGVLLRTGRVEARIGRTAVGHCRIQQSHCYIHHLTPGADVLLSSHAGPVSARAELHLSAGVNEALLRPNGGVDAKP